MREINGVLSEGVYAITLAVQLKCINDLFLI